MQYLDDGRIARRQRVAQSARLSLVPLRFPQDFLCASAGAFDVGALFAQPLFKITGSDQLRIQSDARRCQILLEDSQSCGGCRFSISSALEGAHQGLIFGILPSDAFLNGTYALG